MPRLPTPWSKKRGQRSLGNPYAGVAGEVAFSASAFLAGVFGLSLVLISHWAPQQVPAQVSTEALSTNLSSWVIGTVSLAAIVIGATRLGFRLIHLSASDEFRSVIATRAGAIEMMAPGHGGHGGDGEADVAPLPNVPKGRAITESPGEHLAYRLPMVSGDSGLIGPALLALFWNTAWIILLAVVVSGFWIGKPRWILTFLLVPFAFIGKWSFQFSLSQLRQRLGVGATVVEINEHPLQPGGSYDLFVSQAGRLRLKRLVIRLVCEEETFYRQGTDVRVERHEAFSQILCRERDVEVDPQAPWEQQLGLEIPENVMHSFAGTHNAIRWKIVVKGESRPWPSFCRNYPVVVHPPGLPPSRNPR